MVRYEAHFVILNRLCTDHSVTERWTDRQTDILLAKAALHYVAWAKTWLAVKVLQRSQRLLTWLNNNGPW